MKLLIQTAGVTVGRSWYEDDLFLFNIFTLLEVAFFYRSRSFRGGAIFVMSSSSPQFCEWVTVDP